MAKGCVCVCMESGGGGGGGGFGELGGGAAVQKKAGCVNVPGR